MQNLLKVLPGHPGQTNIVCYTGAEIPGPPKEKAYLMSKA